MKRHRKLTRSPAVAMIADHTGCQSPSRSSKVSHFQVIRKPMCNFLLVIDSNLRPISHRLVAVLCNGFQVHPRLMISISSGRAYATSC